MTYTHRYKNERAYVNIYDEFVISDRTGQYDSFLSTINKVKKEYYDKKKALKTESLDML